MRDKWNAGIRHDSCSFETDATHTGSCAHAHTTCCACADLPPSVWRGGGGPGCTASMGKPALEALRQQPALHGPCQTIIPSDGNCWGHGRSMGWPWCHSVALPWPLDQLSASEKEVHYTGRWEHVYGKAQTEKVMILPPKKDRGFNCSMMLWGSESVRKMRHSGRMSDGAMLRLRPSLTIILLLISIYLHSHHHPFLLPFTQLGLCRVNSG